MKDILSVSESELEIMQVLWKSDEPLSIRRVQESLSGVDWKYNTVGTLLLRLEAKGAVSSKKNGRTIEYKAELDEEVYKSVRTRSLVEKLYNGSVKELAVSLFKSDTMTKEDIDDIKKMFDL